MYEPYGKWTAKAKIMNVFSVFLVSAKCVSKTKKYVAIEMNSHSVLLLLFIQKNVCMLSVQSTVAAIVISMNETNIYYEKLLLGSRICQ